MKQRNRRISSKRRNYLSLAAYDLNVVSCELILLHSFVFVTDIIVIA